MKGKACAVMAAVTVLASVGGPALAGNVTTGLAAYAGHYPSDKVRGGTFRSDPRVVAAVRAAVKDPDIRRDVLVARDVVETPIVALRAGRLFTRSYDPVGGGSTNWAILITGDGGKAAVCYSTDAVYGEGKSTWYYEGRAAFLRDGPCPDRKDDLDARFGTWPAGPLSN